MHRMLVLASTALLSSCSCIVPVSVSGSLDQGITFELREPHKIRTAVVYTHGAWRTVWRIDGKDRVTTLRYGEATGGLSITVSPEGLIKGEVYLFSLDTKTLFNSCPGNLAFAITSEGIAKECSTSDCKERLL